MGDVIAVTGTKREASVLRGTGVRPIAIGGVQHALCALQSPFSAVVSFGMAGALSPDLRIGDWVIGERICGNFNAECDPQWRMALAKALPGASLGAIYADGRLIGDPGEKQALHRGHKSLAADMESHLAAAIAARAGVPFAIVRCISDEAAHALPPAIAVAMRPDGGLALPEILISIMKYPRQLSGIIDTIAHFARAYRALRAGAEAIPGRLAFDLR